MALSAPVKALNVQRSPIDSFTQTSFQAWNADWFPLPGKRYLILTRNMSPRFHGIRTILTSSSSETTAAPDHQWSRLDHGLEQRHWLERWTGARFPGKRYLTVARRRSPRFPGLRTILTCSSSETMVAPEPPMVTSGPRPGAVPLAGTRTGARFPAKRYLTVTRKRSPRFHGLRAILTCSSSETTVTSGPRHGAAPLAGTRTGAPLPGRAVFDLNTQHVTVVSRAPDHLDLFVIGNDGGVGTTNGHVWTTAWSSATGWNADWGPLPGQAVFDRSTAKDRRGFTGSRQS